MRVDEIEPRHPARAKPSAQAIEKIGESAPIRLLRRAREVALRWSKRLGGKAGEAQHVEAIAGVEFVLVRRLETLTKQARDGPRVIERLAGPNHNAAHRPVDAKQSGFQPARTFGLALQQRDQILGEFENRGLDGLALADCA